MRTKLNQAETIAHFKIIDYIYENLDTIDFYYDNDSKEIIFKWGPIWEIWDLEEDIFLLLGYYYYLCL